MAKAWLGDRERALEDGYFRQQDEALIEKLREQGRQERDRQTLKERLGAVDDAVLADLQAAGFSPDTLAVLHLMPLVDVAWADGGVSDRERRLILALAAGRGVEPDTPAHARLTAALDTRPTADELEPVYRVIRSTFELEPPEQRAAAARELTSWAVDVAKATGGVLGLVPISHEERECLRRLAERLPPTTAATT